MLEPEQELCAGKGRQGGRLIPQALLDGCPFFQHIVCEDAIKDSDAARSQPGADFIARRSHCPIIQNSGGCGSGVRSITLLPNKSAGRPREFSRGVLSAPAQLLAASRVNPGKSIFLGFHEQQKIHREDASEGETLAGGVSRRLLSQQNFDLLPLEDLDSRNLRNFCRHRGRYIEIPG